MRKPLVGMLSWAAAALAVSPAAIGQERLTAVRGGEVHTISQGVIRGGAVVFQGGKIVDVWSITDFDSWKRSTKLSRVKRIRSS